MTQQHYQFAELSRIVNVLLLPGSIASVHATAPRAEARVVTASGTLITPFLPVYGRKRKYIRPGEPVLLIAPGGKPEQGVLIPERYDPEQDEQNRRIAALEACCATLKDRLTTETAL